VYGLAGSSGEEGSSVFGVNSSKIEAGLSESTRGLPGISRVLGNLYFVMNIVFSSLSIG